MGKLILEVKKNAPGTWADIAFTDSRNWDDNVEQVPVEPY